MADSGDLDDFFAKKDRSKKKNKSNKFTANDLLAEQGKDPKKEKKKKAKDKEKPQSAGSDRTQEKEDEEWLEIDTEKDYSGLRIQSLQSKQEEETAENQDEPELDEDGEVIERKDGNEGPWKKLESNQPQLPVQKEKDVTEVIEEASKLVINDGKYVPPSRRGGSSVIAPSPLRQTPRKKKAAPNIQSEMDFPTLGGGMEQPRGPGDSSQQFERVRSGGRQAEDYGKTSQLELGNKYDALM